MANQQAAVTVTGFVAGDPTLGGTESFRVLTFRMGSTRSRLNPTTRQWEDYGTAWVGVKAFRALAVNAASSVRRGDRIIVVGSLITEQWTNEQGEPRSRTVLEATNIGHDLTFGTTSLIKPQRAGNGNGGNGGNGNGNANGAVEGMDGGNGQRASSPYVRPTQYGAGGAASGVGIDPYATSSESGPVEFWGHLRFRPIAVAINRVRGRGRCRHVATGRRHQSTTARGPTNLRRRFRRIFQSQ